MTKQLNVQTFREAIAQSNQPVLVDFYADWCPPCKILAPTIDELADDYNDRAVVGKVDVDANQTLASEFDIQSIPTVLVFYNGKIVHRFTGVTPKDVLAEAIDNASSSEAA